jgi:Uncharacterised nucleotidyltransferase
LNAFGKNRSVSSNFANKFNLSHDAAGRLHTMALNKKIAAQSYTSHPDVCVPLVWEMHRCALSWFDTGLLAADVQHAVRWLQGVDGPERFDFLVHHGLAALWADRLADQSALDNVTNHMSDALVAARRTASAIYLMQSAALSQITAELERENVIYAVLKGVATREEAYAMPALRTAGDIDLLVSPSALAAATQCITQFGFVAQPTDSTHEITFSRGQVAIDLHWDILRPGRTRRPLVGSLLARRVKGAKFWRLSDADTVFLMLVHPAITKYVCSRHMGLNRVLDFLRFTQTRTIHWVDVAQRLDEAGLKTAGWCTLRWIQLLMPAAVIPHVSFTTTIQPGKLRAAYLSFWIFRDLPGRLLDRANWLIQAAFTLPMHDKLSDAWQAFRAKTNPDSHRLAVNDSVK